MGRWGKSDTRVSGEFFDRVEADSSSVSDDVLDDPIKLLEWLGTRDAPGGDPLGVPAESGSGRSSEWAAGSASGPARTPVGTSLVAGTPSEAGEEGEPLDNLVGLRAVIRKRLKESGVATIEQLRSIPRWRLLRVPGFGQGKVNEIEVALSEHPSGRSGPKAQPADGTPSGRTELDYLRAKGLPFVDFRPKGGALWVVGDRSIAETLRPLKSKGFFFYFKPEGSRATHGRPAWWTCAASRPIATGLESGSEAARLGEAGARRGGGGPSGEPLVIVRSKIAGEFAIPLDGIIYARPYGSGTAVDTYDSWYLCDMGFMQFARYLEGDSFAFVTDESGFTGAVRIGAVTSVAERRPGCFELYVDLADESLMSVGKPTEWYVDAFGRERVSLLAATGNGVPGSEGKGAGEEDAEGPYVASPELAALLYGIACDGRVNVREAKMLRRWLASVPDEDSRAVREIKELLEKVLDDDVVTLEEEQEMLGLFSKVAGIVAEG